jgi:hypothetical protein
MVGRRLLAEFKTHPGLCVGGVVTFPCLQHELGETGGVTSNANSTYQAKKLLSRCSWLPRLPAGSGTYSVRLQDGKR